METDKGRQVALGTALTVNGAVVAGLVEVGFNMVGYSPPEFSYARYSFILAAVLVGLGGATWLTLTDLTLPWRVFWGLVVGCGVFVLFPATMRWVGERQQIWTAAQVAPLPAPASSNASSPPAQLSIAGPDNASQDKSAHRITFSEQFAPFQKYLYNVNFYKLAKKVVILHAPFGDQPQSIAVAFSGLFVEIGIYTDIHPQTPTGQDQNGIMISVPDVSKPPEAAVVLNDALKTAGITSKYIPLPAGNPMKLPFALFIGPPATP